MSWNPGGCRLESGAKGGAAEAPISGRAGRATPLPHPHPRERTRVTALEKTGSEPWLQKSRLEECAHNVVRKLGGGDEGERRRRGRRPARRGWRRLQPRRSPCRRVLLEKFPSAQLCQARRKEKKEKRTTLQSGPGLWKNYTECPDICIGHDGHGVRTASYSSPRRPKLDSAAHLSDRKRRP